MASDLGRLLLGLGVVLALAGLLLMLLGRFSAPGDFTYRRGGFTFFAPIGTMLLISIVLTVVLNVLLRIGR